MTRAAVQPGLVRPAFRGGDDADFALLCAACRWPRTPTENERLVRLHDDADGKKVRRLAARHRVNGLLAHALHVAGLSGARDDFDWAGPLSSRIAIEDARAALETARICADLAKSGIDALPFKGVALSRLLYGSARIKQSWDIDLLVAPADMARTLARLEAMGYRETGPPTRLTRAMLDLRNETSLRHEGHGLAVEPHWRISILGDLPRGIGTARQTVALDDRSNLATFATPDLILYLALHGAISRWFRLKWLADFDAALAMRDAGPVEALLAQADARGVGASFVLALAVRARLLGRPLPAAAGDRMAHSWRLRWLLRRSEKALRNPQTRIGKVDYYFGMFVLGSLHGARARAMAYVATSPEDLARVSLPRACYWLYPLLRLARLPARLFFRRRDERAGAQ